MREVDFLPEWYPKVRARKRMVGLQAWITLLLVCGLGLWMLLVQRNVHARQVELRSLSRELVQSEVEIQRLEDLMAMQRDLGRQNEIVLKIGRPVETTRVMTTLDELMPKDMALLDLALDSEDPAPVKPAAAGSMSARAQQQQEQRAAAAAAEGAKLRFRMHGVSPTDVDLAEFLARLTHKPFFKQVELMYSHERVEGGRLMREFEVAFTMELGPLGGR